MMQAAGRRGMAGARAESAACERDPLLSQSLTGGDFVIPAPPLQPGARLELRFCSQIQLL